jgi:putative transposase
MKQSVQTLLCSNIKALSSLKKNGNKIGKINFKSDYNSLHVKQCGKSIFKITRSKNCKLPKVSGLVRVNGLDQFINIPGIEIACFDILNTPTGYYISFCTYQDKNKIKKQELKDDIIGIDYGCSTSFTTSEGNKYNFYVEETDKLKRMQRKLARKKGAKKGEKQSNNYYKLSCKIKAEYSKMSNMKNDTANKIAHEFLKHKTVVMQDEQLCNWKMHGHGGKVQHSILGRVKSRLIGKPNVIIINKFAPTTKLCTVCGKLHNEMTLHDREFKCDCGIVEDRDVHAAKNLVWMYENKVGVERTKLTPVELSKQISTAIAGLSNS